VQVVVVVVIPVVEVAAAVVVELENSCLKQNVMTYRTFYKFPFTW